MGTIWFPFILQSMCYHYLHFTLKYLSLFCFVNKKCSQSVNNTELSNTIFPVLYLLYPVEAHKRKFREEKMKIWKKKKFLKKQHWVFYRCSSVSFKQTSSKDPYFVLKVFGSAYEAPTADLSNSVVMLFGRSIGRPRARDQTNDESTPRARDTPNKTV